MSKLLRVNTRKKTFLFEEPGNSISSLGGRGLTSRMILDEVPADCHPLSRDNKIVIAPGILTGTPAANSSRLSVGSKSPLTGGIKESNSGGLVSYKLARLGIKAIVLEDKPEDDAWSMIIIKKNSVEILPADEYIGKGTNEMVEKMWAKYGDKVGVMCIGAAGEQRLSAASIQLADPHGRPGRAIGRGGLGAVMGSKKIKVIIVDDKGAEKVEMADKEAFKAASKAWAKMLADHPVTGQGLPGFGTAILVNIINEAGALPTKNFRSGRFEHAKDISGEKMVELIKERGGVVSEGCCPGCVIKCSQSYNDKDGNYLTSGFEYETIWAAGAHTMIKDMDDIAMLDRICDDVGVDTIDCCVALGIAMEGGVIEWGDGKAAIELLKKVGTDDPMGRIIGNGAHFTGQALGVDRVPTCKKQALPAYDPRAVKGVGVTYATTPMGADHTAGYGVTANILSVGGTVDPFEKPGNIDLSKNLQIATAAVDSAGFCLFVAFAVLDTENALQLIADMVNGRYGTRITPDDIIELGKSVLKSEYEFNEKAGFTKVDDQLPAFFKEQFPPHNVTWDYSIDELQEAKNF
ncbi:MAG: aldehyde ferredoxin oxidoreductase [Desulfobacterales bacterium]|nr:aldehyde ferredoxin oxidoreductase [Desulfobacterales bacterium]